MDYDVVITDVSELKSEMETLLDPFGLHENVRSELYRFVDRAFALGKIIAAVDISEGFDSSERGGWKVILNDTVDRCVGVVDDEPLGYETEAEHKKLEHFADSIVTKMKSLKEED